MSKRIHFHLALLSSVTMVAAVLVTTARGADPGAEAAQLDGYTHTDGANYFALSVKPPANVASAASHRVLSCVETRADVLERRPGIVVEPPHERVVLSKRDTKSGETLFHLLVVGGACLAQVVHHPGRIDQHVLIDLRVEHSEWVFVDQLDGTIAELGFPLF